MTFTGSLLISSPPTSSSEDVFVTPLSNRARLTSPRQLSASPTPRRLLPQGCSLPIPVDAADVNEQAETSAFDNDYNDPDY